MKKLIALKNGSLFVNDHGDVKYLENHKQPDHLKKLPETEPADDMSEEEKEILEKITPEKPKKKGGKKAPVNLSEEKA
jgi:hypothetical protein